MRGKSRRVWRRSSLLTLFVTGNLLALSAGGSAIAAELSAPVSPTTAPATQSAVVHADPGYHVDIRKTIEFLAADEQEGRGVGTQGLVAAGDYVAQAFQHLGLQPVPGLDGYFQPFSMVTATAPDPKTLIAVGDTSYAIGKDYAVASFSGEGSFSGPLEFVGYGITSSQPAYDDYAGVDVKGKVVLSMRFEPHNDNGTSRFAKEDWSVNATLAHKAKVAADHGAVALVLVNPPVYHPGIGLLPFQRQFPGGKSPIPVVQITTELADAWLKQGGVEDLKSVQTAIDKADKPNTLGLDKVVVKGTVGIKRTETPVRNVVAMLPGTGPHADEYVLVGSHYDHLGHGGMGSLAPGSKAVHHGADDNASGTTAMLALADHFAHLGPQARTVIFAAWTAEEEGLIGSQHFASNPPIPLDKIVANLNLDMVGRIRNHLLYVGGSGTAAAFDGFDGLLARADKFSPLELRSFGRGGYGPSDHMSFAMKKIPVLFFFSGMHPDYHRPTDTADKINYQGMQEVVDLGAKLVNLIIDMPKQQYAEVADNGGSPMAHMSGGGGTGGSGVSLGVVPDYSEGIGEASPATKGVKISGTVPGSAAEKAGLKANDVIVQFDADKVDTLYDLSDQLGKHKPGDAVTLGVIRDKQRVDLKATLAAKKSD